MWQCSGFWKIPWFRERRSGSDPKLLSVHEETEVQRRNVTGANSHSPLQAADEAPQ